MPSQKQATVSFLQQSFEADNGTWNFVDITVTLTFLRSMDQAAVLDPCSHSIKSGSIKSRRSSLMSSWPYFQNQFAEVEHIDTHAPLSLRSRMSSLNYIICGFSSPPPLTAMLFHRRETLIVGFARNSRGSRRQELHYRQLPPRHWRVHNGKGLFTRLKRLSVRLTLKHTVSTLVDYISSRQIIVRQTKDPTFGFLAILWSALYAWDEALTLADERLV
jgi:hypothetical protein